MKRCSQQNCSQSRTACKPVRRYAGFPIGHIGRDIAVFLILTDVVKVKKGSESTAHWSINFIRLSGWLRRCFTLLITPPDIDGIGQNWEDSNIEKRSTDVHRPAGCSS